jgi:hypothetical protein
MRARRRFLVGLAAALVLGGIAVQAAAATKVNVLPVSGTLVVVTTDISGPGANVHVEPYDDLVRIGFRVGQQVLGTQPITTTDPACLGNPVANDVVCPMTRRDVRISLGNSADDVQVSRGPVLPPSCIVAGSPRVVTVDLRGGNDLLSARTDCPVGTVAISDGYAFRFDADGGSGNDNIFGTNEPDTLGGGGNDDIIDGRSGNDLINGGTGIDQLRGGFGDDTFCCSSTGSATIDGGEGVDLVTYSPTTAIVGVTIADDSNCDGPVGFTCDKVQGSVENVTTGDGNDTVIGSSSANEVFSGGGRDVLRGEGANDRLVGGTDDDTLSGGPGGDILQGEGDDDFILGGPGVDQIQGGSGDDEIDARDGETDRVVSCGSGFDDLTIDLQDPTPPTTFGCEKIRRLALDDGFPGAAIGRVLTIDAAGAAGVVIACPPRAKVTCRGRLTLRRANRARPVLAGARYAVRRGGRTVVGLALAGVALRPGGRVLAETVERGVSKLGPRSSRTTLTIRR